MHRRRMSVWLTKNSSVRSARGWGRLLIWLGALCVLVHPLWADVNGRFLGTVTDPSGAAVSRAKVSLRNPETGLVRETVTDEAGSYEFLAVPVGDDYIIEVEATGFRKAAQSGLRLLVKQPFRADFELQVGDVVQTLNVVGAPVQVETTNTQLGDVIEDRKMTGLPLNGRSYLDLLGLQAGVVPINNTNGAQPVQPVSGDLPGGQLSVNGQRENANAFMVNGASVEETGYKCKRGEKKHEIGEAYLARHTGKPGLFLILISKAQAPVWEVSSKHHLEWKKPMPYVNHYSFHIWDPEWLKSQTPCPRSG